MEISFASKSWFGINVILGVLNVYNSPNRNEWITAYTLGFFAGLSFSNQNLSDAKNGYPGCHECYRTDLFKGPGGKHENEIKDQKIRQRGIDLLVSGTKIAVYLSAAISTLALIIFTKAAELLGKGAVSKGSQLSAFTLGFCHGNFFNLARLAQVTNPLTTQFVDKIIV